MLEGLSYNSKLLAEVSSTYGDKHLVHVGPLIQVSQLAIFEHGTHTP